MNVADGSNEEDLPCAVNATCATGGDQHCRMYQRYPEALEDADDGCCALGCFLDASTST